MRHTSIPETDNGRRPDQRGGQDRKRIDINQDYELRDWAAKFGVSKDQVKEAVRAVGENAADVETYLKRSRSTTNSERSQGAVR